MKFSGAIQAENIKLFFNVHSSSGFLSSMAQYINYLICIYTIIISNNRAATSVFFLAEIFCEAKRDNKKENSFNLQQ